MSDISPRRRSIGRWTLAAGAALALPLTATVVYAGQDAPSAPDTPTVPAAPNAPAAPQIEKHIEIITQHGGSDAKGTKMFERRAVKDGKTIVILSDKPIDEAKLWQHLANLDKMNNASMVAPVSPVPPVPPLPGTAPAAPGEHREVRKIMMHGGDGDHEGHPAPEAITMVQKCEGVPTIADVDVSRYSGEGDKRIINRNRVLLCGKAGEATASALASVRQARASIAANKALADEIRAEVLKELDHTIADMEKDAG